MRRIGLSFVLAACVLASCGAEAVPAREYRARRAELRRRMTDGVLVLFGRTDKETEDARTGFRQQPDFLYLTGWEEPAAVLVISPTGEMLFLPPHDARAERYSGRRVAAEDRNARTLTGFDTVLPASGFESRLQTLLQSWPKLYAIQPDAPRLKQLAPLRQIDDVRTLLTPLRMKKSDRELECIQRAVDVTVEAHRTAWKRVAPGLFEYQLAATLTAAALERGCARNAYAPIVGSGPDALILHYWKCSRRMEAGELVLIDDGAECSGYAADVTRTVPVSGRFSPRQRELYRVVLGARQAILDAIRPGVTLGATNSAPNSLYKVAYDYIDSHGKDRHGNPLGPYLVHGVSHHVGLEVHDVGTPADPLEPAMVISVEPGIYIPEEEIGIRVEDTVLVTAQGARILSAALPVEPREIEKAMAR